jgi:hypothetical protein
MKKKFRDNAIQSLEKEIEELTKQRDEAAASLRVTGMPFDDFMSASSTASNLSHQLSVKRFKMRQLRQNKETLGKGLPNTGIK